ncbi:MAG: glycoside hydrolase family 18 protein [Steroidobacteraceae bacterium]
MTYWSDNTARFAGYPVPGSVAASGSAQPNPRMQRQLDAINVLAYAFLKVDAGGEVYFGNPAVDLSSGDLQQFCRQNPAACPGAGPASAGSFAAFAHLDNRAHTLQKIISIGGADSQSSLDNALGHAAQFVRTAASLIRAYHLGGIDLDFEPDEFFGPGQGEQYAQLVASLRQALGPAAFISIEVPGDRETLRSIDCPADTRCRDYLALIAANAYVSLMGYSYHSPDYPGAVTANDSNLYADPDEPLLPRFYHVSDNDAVQYLTYRGVPTEKLLLGVPAYFISYGGVAAPADEDGLYQSFDRSQSVAYDLGSKAVGSYRAAQRLLQSGFVPHRLLIGGKLSAVYAYNASLRQWISYDDADSIAAKADYVIARHLGGMMMWEIGEDVPLDSRQSLLGSAHRGLFGGEP